MRQAGCGLVFQFPERHFLGPNLITELLLGAPPPTSPGGAATRAEFAARLPGALSAVGMAEMPLDRDPSTLSDGYKRRLALAVQLMRRPDLLLLDEPLAGVLASNCCDSHALDREFSTGDAFVLGPRRGLRLARHCLGIPGR